MWYPRNIKSTSVIKTCGSNRLTTQQEWQEVNNGIQDVQTQLTSLFNMIGEKHVGI